MEDMNGIEVKNLEIGERVQGTVTKVEEKQVLVDVQDSKVDGIIPISELSSLHIETASDVVSEGDVLELIVTKVEEELLVLSKRKVDAEKAWEDMKDRFEKEKSLKRKSKTSSRVVLSSISAFAVSFQLHLWKITMLKISQITRIRP